MAHHPHGAPARSHPARPRRGPARRPALVLALGQALALAIAAAPAWPGAVQAQALLKPYAIPAGPLEAVIQRFGQEAGVMLSYTAASLAGKRSAGVSGPHTVDEALRAILRGTGLEAVAQPNGGYLVRAAAPAAPAAPVSTLPAVPVSAPALRDDAPGAYAGGQLARAAQLGVLGAVDYMAAPFSVRSFTREFLDSTQARAAGDVIRYDASVQAAQASPNGINDVFYIRGFQTHAGRASFDGLPNLLNRMAPLEAVERVELFKGPSAFLNGRTDAVGGTVNLVPKRAGSEPLTQLTARYESDSVFGLHADVGRRFGANEAWGLRVNAAAEDGETAVRPSSRNTRSLALALDYRGDGVRLAFDYIHQTRHQRPSTGESVMLNANVPVPAAPEASRVFGQRWTFYDRELNLWAARADWDIAPDLTATFSYGRSDDKEDSLSPIHRVTNAAGDLTNTSFNYTLAPIGQDSAQALLTRRFSTGGLRHALTAGIASTRYDQRNDRRTLNDVYASNLHAPVFHGAPVVPAGFNRSERSRVDNTGLFVGDQIHALDDRLRITLGLRHVELKAGTRDLLTDTRTAAYAKRKTTPAVGLLLAASPRWSFYGNYVEALEQGGTAPASVSNAGDTLPPLVSRQVEIGAKADFGAIGGTLGVFRITQPGEIVRGGALVQEGKQVNTGVELSVFGAPGKTVRLLGGITWIDARNEATGTPALDGKTAIGVPRLTATANAEWDVPAVPGLTLSSGVVHVGRQYYDASNERSLPGWTRWDAGARYAFALGGRPGVLALSIQNLADRNYWQHNDRGRIWLGAPRTVLLSMTTRF